MSLYYHGTTVANLNELKPFASPFSNIKTSCVYLSGNKPLAAIYIWNKPYKWMTFEIAEDGTPIYKESFQNSLKEFYDGVSGCIYTCEGEFSSDTAIGIKHAVISEIPVPITSCDIVDNAYERILQYEKAGTIIIRRFENLTQKEHDSNKRMVLNTIKRLNLLAETHPLSSFVKEKYPDLWEQSLREINSHIG